MMNPSPEPCDVPMSVVVFDDEERVCRLIVQLINWGELGLTLVGTSHNGLEALDLIKRVRPDLVITDIRMPGMDGLELIAKAKDVSEKTSFVIISGHNQFEYAHNAIRYGVEDYLLKPIRRSELNETLSRISGRFQERVAQEKHSKRVQARLESSIEKLRENFFRDYVLSGASPVTQNIDAINELYGYRFTAGAFVAAIAKLDCDPTHFTEKMVAIIEEAAQSLLRHTAGEYCHDIEFFRHGSRIYMIMNTVAPRLHDIRKAFRRSLDELQLKTTIFEDARLTIAFGVPVGQVHELHASAAAANAALGDRLFDQTSSFFDVTPGYTVGVYDNILAEWNRKMEHICDSLDVVAALSAVDTIVSRMREEPRCTGATFVETIREAGHRAFILLRDRNMQGVDNWGDIQRRFDQSIDVISSAANLADHLKGRIEALFTTGAEARESAGSKPIRDAKQYIVNNFRDKILSLEQVSEAVGLNPSYLSSLFKTQTGMGFLEYVTLIRIEEAKTLLHDGKKTVAEIASDVGYSDTKYFTRLFKKHAGLKPSEYRKLYG